MVPPLPGLIARRVALLEERLRALAPKMLEPYEDVKRRVRPDAPALGPVLRLSAWSSRSSPSTRSHAAGGPA